MNTICFFSAFYFTIIHSYQILMALIHLDSKDKNKMEHFEYFEYFVLFKNYMN